MKLVPILASIITGFAMLATVGSASASATEFNLTGTFASNDFAGATGLAGGSFNGTYSYSGGAVSAGNPELLSSFSINLLNASNTVVDTFNSNNSGNSGAIANNTTFDDLLLQNTDTALQLAFPTDFDGTGSITTNNIFANIFSSSSSSSGLLLVTSATSTLVPEPSPIVGTLAVGAVLMVMGLKKSKRQKAFQAA